MHRSDFWLLYNFLIIIQIFRAFELRLNKRILFFDSDKQVGKLVGTNLFAREDFVKCV